MVDHFTDLTYVILIRHTSQDEILARKADFERWAATFGVEIHRYHADNERFSEQHLKSAIEDPNQTKHFVSLDNIIKIPFLKETFKLYH